MNPNKYSKKQRILQAALEVSSTDTQSAYITRIAQKADVDKRVVYQYFKNKEELCCSMLTHRMETLYSELERESQEGQDSPLNKLRKFVWLYLYQFKKNPSFARTLMLEIPGNRKSFRSRTLNRFKLISSRVLELVRDCQKAGLIRRDLDGRVIQELMMGILEHRVTRWVLKERKYDLLENYDAIFNFALAGEMSS